MKKFFIGLFIFILVLLLLAAAALFIILKKFDINVYKPKIIKQLSESIGRDVELGRLSLDISLQKGIALGVQGFSIANDDVYQDLGKLVKADYILLDVDAMPFIQERKILVKKVEVRKPEINLIIDKNGQPSIPKPAVDAEKNSDPAQNQDVPEAEDSSSKESFDLSKLEIKSIELMDGSFNLYQQQLHAPNFSVKDFDLHIHDFSLSEFFNYDLACSVFSANQNVEIKGQARVEPSGQVSLQLFVLNVNLAKMSIAELEKNIPDIKQAGLQERLAGELQITVETLAVNQGILEKLKANGELKDGWIKLKDVNFPIENIDMRFSADEKNVHVQEILVYAGSGKINATGEVLGYLKDQTFSANVFMEDLALQEFLKEEDLGFRLEGKLIGKMDVKGRGFAKQDLTDNLQAVGDWQVVDGKVIDVNLLKIVLEKMSVFPNLVEQIETNLPLKYKERLKAKDTLINEATLQVNIQKGVLTANPVKFEAEGFRVTAQGSVDNQNNLTADADFYIVRDLTQSMLTAVSDLSYLVDENGLIHIPLTTYRGPMNKFIMYPDLGDLGEQILRNKGKDELRKVIFKALDIEEGTSGPAQNPQSPQTTTPAPNESAPQEASPEEELINKALEAIFK